MGTSSGVQHSIQMPQTQPCRSSGLVQIARQPTEAGTRHLRMHKRVGLTAAIELCTRMIQQKLTRLRRAAPHRFTDALPFWSNGNPRLPIQTTRITGCLR